MWRFSSWHARGLQQPGGGGSLLATVVVFKYALNATMVQSKR